ncbi:type II secretion system F family protein [Desulfurococcus mucosus]|uniref:Type II secretion system F domain protein n=1 Tax=Desulfurococcus mucosus (strain ATCC 35584 / DSM 2162 / JCM 9187 / O7/1) TaxID=765177 RepID=E8R7X8_DESM0|nr:type II secretion system F family protein [Desulfurococcus mucosus]ADV64604.1 Type II secretion system F domain protein [Desulfurococcus mucosus DSM 2162]
MRFWDWVYKYFNWIGKRILKMFPNIGDSIKKSGIHMHSEVYAALTGLVFIVSLAASITLTILLALLFRSPLGVAITVSIPTLVLLLMVSLPSLYASNRASSIDGEFPFLSSYLSTMVMSGLSPYIAFERILKGSTIFKRTSELAQRFILLNRILGRDPLTAFDELAKRTPSSRVKETLSGYIATVKAGGDVVDYLNKRSRLLFNEMLVGMKIIADRLGGLLEAYLAMILLTMISFTVLYFVTTGFAGVVPFGLSSEGMFFFLYIVMPLLSGVIIYLADLIQFKDPFMDWKPYMVFFATFIPITLLLVVFGVFFYTMLPPYHPLRMNPFTQLTGRLLLLFNIANPPGYMYSSIALSTALIIASLPGLAYYIYSSREYKVTRGITRFLRDLVEVRKTGLPPERSIIELSPRDYGVFTPHLRKIAMELSIGIPLRRITDEVMRKIRSWIGQVLLFILTDSIEVGGGTVEVLENLAWFAESVEAIEDERKRSLRTLMIVPYMGGILSAVTVIYMVGYMAKLPIQVGTFNQAAGVVLPSIVLNNYVMGIVAGKVSSGRVIAGVVHAVLLTLITLIVMLATPFFTG